MDHSNAISELRKWAKDDIVPSDLQDLCNIAAEGLEYLQAELTRKENHEETINMPIT